MTMQRQNEHGMALIAALMIMLLMSALMIGFTTVVMSDQRSRGIDKDRTRAFYGAQSGLEKLTVDLGTGEIVEHTGRGGEDDAPGGLAGAIREGPSEEGLAGPGGADEQRVDALVEEREVVECEVASPQLFADWVEVEVEAVDGVELGEFCVLDAAVDGALHATGAFLVTESVEDLEVGQVVVLGLVEE